MPAVFLVLGTWLCWLAELCQPAVSEDDESVLIDSAAS